MSQYNVLIALVQNEITKLEIAVQSATAQAEKARITGDSDYLQAAALNIQNFYTGTERIFEEIAKHIDGQLPVGASSHKELLEQMSLAIPETRPAVIQSTTTAKLNAYRGFRHVVIHIYAFELYPNRIQDLVIMLPETYALFVQDIQTFCQFLRDLNRSL